jgi:MATE family multidrug resistance protein
LTGSTRTKIGATINFVTFYLVALPVLVVMAFSVKVGFIGLWFGLAAAQPAGVPDATSWCT